MCVADLSADIDKDDGSENDPDDEKDPPEPEPKPKAKAKAKAQGGKHAVPMTRARAPPQRKICKNYPR